MNPNMSIYRRLNSRLLVQVKVGLSLLHWANMSNISLTIVTVTSLKFFLTLICSLQEALAIRHHHLPSPPPPAPVRAFRRGYFPSFPPIFKTPSIPSTPTSSSPPPS